MHTIENRRLPARPEKTNEQIALRVGTVTVIGNVALSIFKLVAGLTGHSAALVTDAIHSATDVVGTLALMAGFWMAARSADKKYPYGYERMESIAAILLAMILAVTGIGVGVDGIKSLLAGSGEGLVMPSQLALVAALVSIAAKEGMYWYTRAAAKRIGSGALMADAWHQRADAMSSVGSFIGVLGARMGFSALDPLASLVICGFIVKTALDIFKDAAGQLTDKACDEETSNAIWATVEAQQGVRGVKQLKTRLFGDRIYVDIDIMTDGDVPLWVATSISERVEAAVEANFPKVKSCTVRTVPYEKYTLKRNQKTNLKWVPLTASSREPGAM